MSEGTLTIIPPSFNGKSFQYWKGKMKLFWESQDVDLWDIKQIIGP